MRILKYFAALAIGCTALAGCAAHQGAVVLDTFAVNEKWEKHCPKDLPPEQPLLCRYENKAARANVFVTRNKFKDATTPVEAAQAYAAERERGGAKIEMIVMPTANTRATFSYSWSHEGADKMSQLVFYKSNNSDEVLVAVGTWPRGYQQGLKETTIFLSDLMFSQVE